MFLLTPWSCKSKTMCALRNGDQLGAGQLAVLGEVLVLGPGRCLTEQRVVTTGHHTHSCLHEEGGGVVAEGRDRACVHVARGTYLNRNVEITEDRKKIIGALCCHSVSYPPRVQAVDSGPNILLGLVGGPFTRVNGDAQLALVRVDIIKCLHKLLRWVGNFITCQVYSHNKLGAAMLAS